MDITERKITKIAREAEKLVLCTLREKGVGTAEIDLIHALRHNPGCTQAELAKRSNVSLRSIQMYEQRNKDINRASAETVLNLAKVLGCTMEDLLEK